MSQSISEIARLNKPFILQQIGVYEQQLLPSSEEDQELVRRAVFSVRNKSVIFERYVPFSNNLYTIVQDVKSPQVVVDFNNEKIKCACPINGICRHELAVLLSLYQYFDSVQDWASNWRAKKNVQLESLAADRSPANWRTLIDEVMRPHTSVDKKLEGYAITTVTDMARTRLNRYTPFEREWIPMFKLFCELGIFNHVLRQYSDSFHHDSNQLYYLQYYADKTVDRITNYVDELAAQSRLFAIDPFYDELQNMVFELLQHQTRFPALQMNLYLLFWKKLFTNIQRSELELEKLLSLHQLQEHTQQNERDFGLSLKPVLAIFYMLLKDMQAIDGLLKVVQPREIEQYLIVVEFANRLQLFDVATKILHAVLPHLNTFLHEMMSPMQRQQFAYKVDQLFEHVTLAEDEELLFYSSLGKYGVQPFSAYLIRNNRFDEWAALHQLHPSSMSYLETCGLKVVLAENPAVTLPLYHHFAMDELRQKSRVNYKQAVRIWKSMRSAAKKASKTSFFEDYIAVVRSENKRLRALQEEMDKGNL